MDLLFIGFSGIHLSHEIRVQLDNASHTCINLKVYSDDEHQVLFNGDFARENFACTMIGTRDLPTQVFVSAAVTFLSGFSASYCIPDTAGPLLVACTLGDLVVTDIATVLVASKQTQRLSIRVAVRLLDSFAPVMLPGLTHYLLNLDLYWIVATERVLYELEKYETNYFYRTKVLGSQCKCSACTENWQRSSYSLLSIACIVCW